MLHFRNSCCFCPFQYDSLVNWHICSLWHGNLVSPASAPYSVAGEEQDSGRSAVAIVTVATSEWASYSCFVSHRRHARVIRTHHATFTGRARCVCVRACVCILSNDLVYCSCWVSGIVNNVFLQMKTLERVAMNIMTVCLKVSVSILKNLTAIEVVNLVRTFICNKQTFTVIEWFCNYTHFWHFLLKIKKSVSWKQLLSTEIFF